MRPGRQECERCLELRPDRCYLGTDHGTTDGICIDCMDVAGEPSFQERLAAFSEWLASLKRDSGVLVP
jgi:hypothetical protein